MIFLKGLGLEYYRGIGAEAQKMDPFKRFNIFIGANNAGKSTVLNFISKHLNHLDAGSSRSKTPPPLEPLERHITPGSSKTEQPAAFIANSKDEFLSAINSRHTDLSPSNTAVLNKLVNGLSERSLVWFKTSVPRDKKAGIAHSGPRSLLSDNEWYQLWRALTGKGQGSVEQHWFPETIERLLADQNLKFPQNRCRCHPSKPAYMKWL